MRGVMALASQKVEEFSKDGGSSWISGYQRGDNGLLDDEMDRHNYEGIKEDRKNEYPGGSQWDDWTKSTNTFSKESSHDINSKWDDWDDELHLNNQSDRDELKSKGRFSMDPSQSIDHNNSTWDTWDDPPPSKSSSIGAGGKSSHTSNPGNDNWAGWDVKDEGDDFFGSKS